MQQTQHQMTGKQPVVGTARADQFEPLPAKLVICTQEIVEEIGIVLQESDLRGARRRAVEEAINGDEIRERIGGVARLDQRLEGRVGCRERIAESMRETASANHVEKC